MSFEKHFSVVEIILLLIITLAGVVTSVILKWVLVIGFLPGLLFLLLLTVRKGVTRKAIFQMSMRGVWKTKEVIIILFLVGLLLPSWYLSGTIEQMVSISLQILSPSHFLLLSFFLMMILSMLLGTSIGTLSALGIPIMSAAITLQFPVEMVAGALISGAFVGDRSSPFSSAHQLLASTVEVPVYKQFRKIIPTTIAAVAISIVVYYFLDSKLQQMVNVSQAPISTTSWNEISYLTLIPPFILLLFVVFRIKIRYAFLASIFTAVLIAVFTKGVSWVTLSYHLWYGVDTLGGGTKNMVFLLLFIALAGIYNGLLEDLKVIQPLLNRWLEASTSRIQNTLKTMMASFTISVIACNQTLPIILTGRSLLPHWKKHHSEEDLSRVMADSTMLFPGMIPWSVLAIMSSTIVGVPVFSYLSYAIFLWVLPIITIIWSIIEQAKETKQKFHHHHRSFVN